MTPADPIGLPKTAEGRRLFLERVNITIRAAKQRLVEIGYTDADGNVIRPEMGRLPGDDENARRDFLLSRKQPQRTAEWKDLIYEAPCSELGGRKTESYLEPEKTRGMRKHDLEAKEGSVALSVGINPFDYRGGVMPPSGNQIGRMLWALNNHDALQREAEEGSRRRWKMEERLGPFWNSNAVAIAFREAEANFRLSGLDPLEIDQYRVIKAQLIARELDFDGAVRLAVEHYTVADSDPVPSPAASDDPYCYPGTNVLRNKLGIRDKRQLEIAETVIGTLRNAQLNLFGPADHE